MSTSKKRVASLHMARLQKRAGLLDNLKEKVGKAVLESEAEKERAKISNKALKGLQMLGKREGVKDPKQVIKLSRSKPKEHPLGRMLEDRLKKASSKNQVEEIVGLYSYYMEKNDLKNLAKTLDVAEETLMVTILWYSKDKSSAWVNPKGEVPQVFKQVGINENTKLANPIWMLVCEALGWAGWIGTQIIYYLGVGAGWLFKFILPEAFTSSMAGKGLLAGVSMAWESVFWAIGKVGGALMTLMKALGAFMSVGFALKLLAFSVVVYYIWVGFTYGWYELNRVPGKLFIEMPLKVFYKILRLLAGGVQVLTGKQYKKVKKVVEDTKKALPKNDPIGNALPAV